MPSESSPRSRSPETASDSGALKRSNVQANPLPAATPARRYCRLIPNFLILPTYGKATIQSSIGVADLRHPASSTSLAPGLFFQISPETQYRGLGGRYAIRQRIFVRCEPPPYRTSCGVTPATLWALLGRELRRYGTRGAGSADSGIPVLRMMSMGIVSCCPARGSDLK